MTDWELRYYGLSYQAASKEAARLIARAHGTGEWFSIVDQLIVLKSIMWREARAERAAGRLTPECMA